MAAHGLHVEEEEKDRIRGEEDELELEGDNRHDNIVERDRGDRRPRRNLQELHAVAKL